jgi:alpha-L-fucosidase 2
MDMTITRELMANTINASKILHTDRRFRKELEEILPRLSPLQIGSDGRIMEWTEEFKEPEPGHRHMSHLYGLYPGNEISVTQTPEFAEAARKTIDYRLSHGGGHTGWSRAWIINFFARLRDGEKAYDNLLALLRKSTLPTCSMYTRHSRLMVILAVLPVLPRCCFKARGNFEVDIEWKNGELVQAVVKSLSGNETRLRYGDEIKNIDLDEGAELIVDFTR